jgi:hypothetical protein
VFIFGLTDDATKAIISTTKNKDSEFTPGPMEKYTRAIGRMVFSMVVEFTFCLMASQEVGIGSMEIESNGLTND